MEEKAHQEQKQAEDPGAFLCPQRLLYFANQRRVGAAYRYSIRGRRPFRWAVPILRTDRALCSLGDKR